MRNPQAIDEPSGRIYFRWQDRFHEALATILLLLIVLIMFCAVFWLTTHYAKPIEGASMQSTINNYDVPTGDIAVVSSIIRYTYDDIIIVDMTKTDSTDAYVSEKLLIKRVLALPGDSIKLVPEGNGEYCFYRKKANETTFTKIVNENVQPLTSYGKAMTFWNQLNWTHTLARDNSNGGAVTIPEGYIFFAGDNRNHSYDCRDFGPTSASGVVGVVEAILPKDSFFNKLFSIVNLFNVRPVGGA